jgi:hypothetical protein
MVFKAQAVLRTKICPHFNGAIRLTLLAVILITIPSLAVSASATITLVQHASSDAGTTSTALLAFPSNNTTGNWIGVCIRAGATNESFTVVDSRGNVYRQAIQFSETNNGNSFGIYYAENVAGGANSIRVSDTATATLRVAILEYSGVATSGSLDVIAAAQGHSATPTSGLTGSTTASGDLLLGTIMTANSARFTAGSGYAIVESVPVEPGTKLLVEGQIQATTGVASASVILGATDYWAGGVAAFKPGTQSGGTAPGITSVNNTTFTLGTAATFTVTATGTPTPSLTGTGTLPSGVIFKDSGNGTATLSGTPGAGTTGSYLLTISARNGVGTDASQAFTLTVGQGSVITSANSATFTVGTAGSFTVTTKGGTPSAACTASQQKWGSSPVIGFPDGGTPPASNSVNLTGNVSAVGDLVAITAWCFPPTFTGGGCTPVGVTMGSQSAVRTSVAGQPDTGSAGTPGSGQGWTYYILSAAAAGLQTITFSTVETQQLQISYMDFKPSAGCTFSHDVDSPRGSGRDVGTSITAPSITPSAGDLLFNFTWTSSHMVDPVGSPWAPSIWQPQLSHFLPNSANLVAYDLSAPSGTTSNNANTLHNGDSWQSLITSFSLSGSLAGNGSSSTPTPSLTMTGVLPSGVIFIDNGNGTATLGGIPAAGTTGSYLLTITAHNGVGADSSQAFTLTVGQASAISSANSAAFTVGTAGTFTAAATGFPTPSLTESGALPSGVTFVDKGTGTATLSGTPATGTAGSYPITIKAHNGVGADASQSFMLTVSQTPAPAITSAGSTAFTIGTAGTFTVTAAGTPTPSLSEAGALPSGVTFTDNANGTATLSGTPGSGAGGIYPFTITAHNGVGTDASQSFTLSVGSALSIGFVQVNYATPQGTQTKAVVVYAQAQTAGNLNVVVVGWNNSTAQLTSVSDSKGNAYALAVGPTVQTGAATQAIYYAKNIAAAAANGNTVTVTFNTGANSPDVRIAEYAGIDPTNPVDAAVAAQGSGTSSNSGSVNTGNANDLLVGANLVQQLTSGPGSGYTRRVITSPDGDILEDQIVSTTGSHNATAVISGGAWIMQMVAFRAAASGVGTTVSVTLTPKRAAVTASQGQQYTATVTDPQNAGVSWSVDGINSGNSTVGTVSATGLFTPGSQIGIHTVAATSNSNNTVSASASIAVTDLQGVFTYHNDTARTGQNLQEYALTTATVNSSTFGVLFSCHVDGYVYAQPLYIANLNVGGQTRNVLFVATEHDSVYAFDADSSSCVQLWQISFLSSGVTTVPAADTGELSDLIPEIGITSTPAIDSSTNTIFAVAKTKETTGSGCSSSTPCYVHRLHALDMTTGAEKFGGPMVLSAPNFVPLFHLQRPALLLNNGTVYIGFGSHGDNNTWQGWLMAYSYNSATLTQSWVWHSTDPTSGNNEGAIWGSGNGPALDASGNIYLETGNGVFDGTSNFSDSVVKLTPAGVLLDSFTPYDQGVMQSNDIDLGSSGPIILPDAVGSATNPHVMIATGKVGVVYLLDQTNMGKYNTGANQDLGEVTVGFNTTNITGGFFGQPAYWNGSIYSIMVGDSLREFSVGNGTISSVSSSNSNNTFTFRGATPTVSSSGTTNGIVWVADITAYQSGGAVILDVYDATNVTTPLYSSPASGSGAAAPAAKFTVPTVANGKVYVGGQLAFTVFGLLPD